MPGGSMNRRMSLLSLGFLALLAAAAPDSIYVVGGPKPLDLSIAQIQSDLSAEIKPVDYKSKGVQHSFNCVPLISVLKEAGVQTDFVMQPGADPKTKNPQVRRVVLVTGSDGYSVVFSLAELIPAIGNRTVWLALEEDGKPLTGTDAPARLIVPDDKMPARAVHQIASINVIDISAPTTQPAQ
jgi:hypothetical protein